MIEDIDQHGLTTKTEIEGGVVRAALVGRAESIARPLLDPFLKSLHETAITMKPREVVIDFRQLELMTSSCFKAFVTWVGAVSDAPPGSQYRIRFVADAKRHWQNRSLAALACFAEDLVEVETS